MSHTLSLVEVAEGVETPERLAFLRSIRWDKAQARLLGRPLAAGSIGRLSGEATA